MFNISQSSKKNNQYVFIIILLILIIMFLFILKKHKNQKNANTLPCSLLNNYDTYTYQGNEITINICNTTTEKKFRFTLIAQYIQYLSEQKTIQLIQPNITIFDIKNIAIWKITSNKAILNYEQKIINLHGYIHINNILNNTYFSSIITNQATINLITNNIFSNTTVILHGYYFYSIGTQMHGNLYTQTIQLIKKTHTYYEI